MDWTGLQKKKDKMDKSVPTSIIPSLPSINNPSHIYDNQDSSGEDYQPDPKRNRSKKCRKRKKSKTSVETDESPMFTKNASKKFLIEKLPQNYNANVTIKPKKLEIKNTNKAIHAKNPEFILQCCLCDFSFNQVDTMHVEMVQHFVLEHGTQENFISRLSPGDAKNCKDNSMKITGSKIQGSKITFHCLFCLHDSAKCMLPEAWIAHIALHTGENYYKCKSCQVRVANLSDIEDEEEHFPTCKQILPFEKTFADRHLIGFMCDACNYVQIFEENLKKHVEIEHNGDDVKIIQISLCNYADTKISITQNESKNEKTLKITGARPKVLKQDLKMGTSEIGMKEMSSSLTNENTPGNLTISTTKDLNYEVNLHNLVPWIPNFRCRKSNENRRRMLQYFHLCCLFKCMASSCSFNTSVPSNFLEHLDYHQRRHPEDAEYFSSCSYCSYHAKKIHELIGHVLSEHCLNGLQCSHCFFRTCIVNHLITHLNDYHKDKKKLILVILQYTYYCSPAFDPRSVTIDASAGSIQFREYIINMPDSTRSTQLVIQNAQFQQDPQATLENDIESFVYPHETSTRSVSGKNVGVKFVIYPNDSFKIIDVQSNPTTTNHDSATLQAIDKSVSTISQQKKVDAIIESMVIDSGVENSHLYRCGIDNCDSLSKDTMSFYQHLVFHNTRVFPCFHCNEILFGENNTSDHYNEEHVRKRFICLICYHKEVDSKNLWEHISRDHNIDANIQWPLSLNNKYCNSDSFTLCAKTVTEEKFEMIMKNLIHFDEVCKEACLPKEITFYDPKETELLPNTKTFGRPLFCRVCGFSSRIRLYLYRHLKQHLKQHTKDKESPEIPSDIIMDLTENEEALKEPEQAAISSADAQNLETIKLVPINQRYKCNVKCCHYLSLDTEMFKSHLSTLHSKEEKFACPHCEMLICEGKMNVGLIMTHLMLHGEKLFRCSRCSYYDSNFFSMKSHCKVHMDEEGINEVQIEKIRNNRIRKQRRTPAIHKISESWKCEICNISAPSRKKIVQHMVSSHQFRAQFKCSHCMLRFDTINYFEKHFKLFHPNDNNLRVISMFSSVSEQNISETDD